MSTPSSTTDAPPPRSRDLRDRPLGRIAIIVVVLAIAGVSARSCSGGDSKLSEQEAVDRARTVAVIKRADYVVRYLNQGIPPRGTWIVSFFTGPAKAPVTAQTVLVDAETGAIIDDGR